MPIPLRPDWGRPGTFGPFSAPGLGRILRLVNIFVIGFHLYEKTIVIGGSEPHGCYTPRDGRNALLQWEL